MELVFFSFPTPSKDGTKRVEEMYCQLVNRKRSGEPLDPEELDYMDYANTVLSENNG